VRHTFFSFSLWPQQCIFAFIMRSGSNRQLRLQRAGFCGLYPDHKFVQQVLAQLLSLQNKRRQEDSRGEYKAKMLVWLGYGAAARVSGDCDDGGRIETVEAFALDAKSLYGPGQLPKTAGELPLAGRSAADATHDAGTRDALEGFVDLAKIVVAANSRAHIVVGTNTFQVVTKVKRFLTSSAPDSFPYAPLSAS
jgi:hypothetical protein